jgi:50S ribosomal protein L16 3-hydroxylase
MTPLGGVDVATFLELHWQKRPLCVRGAIPNYRCPLTPQELAGLACDDDVTSRLVLEQGGERPWQVRHGPFTERDFTSLGESGWSLMVQEVDHLVPSVADLLQHFRFVPNWRIDDVMVSHAPPGGSVGAHVDNHDVFLFQGRGRRRWQIQRTPVVDERLVPELDVRMLADFAPDDEWVLEPGDLLYLPPRIAHHGVALEDCMTFSIGFSAPEAGELFAAFVTEAIESGLTDGDDPLSRAVNRRYADPDLEPAGEPGEITESARRRLSTLLHEVIADQQTIDRWLGCFLTAPRRIAPRPPETEVEGAGVGEALRGGAELLRSAVPHFAFFELEGTTYLYVGGQEHTLAPDTAFAGPLLSGSARLTGRTLAGHLDNPRFVELLRRLIEEGFLEFA